MFLSLFVLFFLVSCGAIVVTRDEASIAGVQYNEPFIVAEFLISTTYHKAMLLSSKISEHVQEANEGTTTEVTSRHLHTLAEEFCDGRARQCTSREYYLILDKIIEMNSENYEYRIRDMTEVRLKFESSADIIHIESSKHSSSSSSKRPDNHNGKRNPCDLQVLPHPPSPEEFYHFIKNSKPFIIRSPVQSNNENAQYTNPNPNAGTDATSESADSKQEHHLWSLQDLLSMFGNATIIVNASPTSEFDGVSLHMCVLITLFTLSISHQSDNNIYVVY
mgnify:CR=1 FL=1